MVAGYFSTLLEYVMEAGEADDDAYGLLVRAYRYLTEKPVEWKAVIHFEKELAVLLGVWDGRSHSQAHQCLRRAFGGLPKSRETCEGLFGRR
jgi:hypothetical protein